MGHSDPMDYKTFGVRKENYRFVFLKENQNLVFLHPSFNTFLFTIISRIYDQGGQRTSQSRGSDTEHILFHSIR